MNNSEKMEKYRKKRDFTKTPEPSGEIKSGGKNLIFLIHKHNASHLHYDLRLELNGVLKSWAIPKEPSLNPDEKHLAIMVEDHPIEYANFEGVIPESNYGAGIVMIWDKGVYVPVSDGIKEEQEKILNQELEKGHLSIIFDGKKLKGEFALVKLRRSREQNAWLLIKAKDQYAKYTDILKEDKRAKSVKKEKAK